MTGLPGTRRKCQYPAGQGTVFTGLVIVTITSTEFCKGEQRVGEAFRSEVAHEEAEALFFSAERHSTIDRTEVLRMLIPKVNDQLIMEILRGSQKTM